MIDYKFSYLIGDLIFLVVWLILFYRRKDLRKEMLLISIIFGFLGLVFEYFYVRDWWKPQTIFGTSLGIEDFLFGFTISGIASSIYEDVFKKKLRGRKTSLTKTKRQNLILLKLIVGLSTLFVVAIYLGLHSYYVTILVATVSLLFILYKRKDLLIDSIISGLLISLVAVLDFEIVEFLSPGVVKNMWFGQVYKGILIFHAPIEDVVWFFVCGMVLGPLYEFWKEKKLIRKLG